MVIVPAGMIQLEDYLIFIFALIVTVVVANILYSIISMYLSGRIGHSFARWVARVFMYAVFAAGTYYAAYYALGLDITALLASLGILGIAVAFASQQILQNFLAGVLISLSRPIQLDDWVQIGGEPATGVSQVKDMTLTRTVLRDLDGRIYYVPNSLILTSKIVNYSRSVLVQVSVQFTVPKDADLSTVRETILASLDAHAAVLPNVSAEEERRVRSLLELPPVRKLFPAPTNLSTFQPDVLVTASSLADTTLSIRFWIREIVGRDRIVSSFLVDLHDRMRTQPLVRAEQTRMAVQQTG
jgi:small-conductance mechanosensitive channel